MILCDRDLRALLPLLIRDPDAALVNPASIDIRVGHTILRETGTGEMSEEFEIAEDGEIFRPGDFALVPTFEYITVPNGYAVDLRLKSTIAREGWDHALAFWVDPGWRGNLTMEIRNVRKRTNLRLLGGMRFAQIIVHKLSGLADKPYAGRYQGATGAQEPRDENSSTPVMRAARRPRVTEKV